MKMRLFGKILIAFWLMMFVMSQVLWLMYSGGYGRESPEQRAAARSAQPVLTLLAHRVETSGGATAQRELQLLPHALRNRITISLASEHAIPSSSGRQVVAMRPVAPGGRQYLVIYHPERGSGPLDIPTSILISVAVAGLIFSVALAQYLTRPMLLLREGFSRLARGDLTVRLKGRVGRRVDEIGDLAGAFDHMAERLGQLLTARDRLLNDVSHELRSPLTRLQLAIALARQDPRRTEDSFDRIDREARKLEAMVQELLTLARVESGALEDGDEYFDPIALVGAVVADAQFEAQMSGRRIDAQLPSLREEFRPSVRGSAELLRRAIENIVRNALRFSPANGTVHVQAEFRRSPDCFRLVVADEGAGVQDMAVDQLFEPFVRGGAAGVGLGLSIAKRAIVAHKGGITARNGAGGGFVVEVEVPVISPSPYPECASAPPA